MIEKKRKTAAERAAGWFRARKGRIPKEKEKKGWGLTPLGESFLHPPINKAQVV